MPDVIEPTKVGPALTLAVRAAGSGCQVGPDFPPNLATLQWCLAQSGNPGCSGVWPNLATLAAVVSGPIWQHWLQWCLAQSGNPGCSGVWPILATLAAVVSGPIWQHWLQVTVMVKEGGGGGGGVGAGVEVTEGIIPRLSTLSYLLSFSPIDQRLA